MQITDKILEILNGMVEVDNPLTPPSAVVTNVVPHTSDATADMSYESGGGKCGWIKTVMFDTEYSANVRIDKKKTPAALFYSLPSFTVTGKNGLRKDSAEIEVFFFDRCTFAAKGETTKTVMDGVEPIALEFIARVMSEPTLVVENDNIEVVAAVGKFDANVAGWSVQMRITEKQGRCLLPSTCN